MDAGMVDLDLFFGVQDIARCALPCLDLQLCAGEQVVFSVSSCVWVKYEHQ